MSAGFFTGQEQLCALAFAAESLKNYQVGFTCVAQASEHASTQKLPEFTRYLPQCERQDWMQIFPPSGGCCNHQMGVQLFEGGVLDCSKIPGFLIFTLWGTKVSDQLQEHYPQWWEQHKIRRRLYLVRTGSDGSSGIPSGAEGEEFSYKAAPEMGALVFTMVQWYRYPTPTPSAFCYYAH